MYRITFYLILIFLLWHPYLAQKKMLLTAFVPKAVSLFNNTIPDVNGKKARGSFFASMSRNSFGSFSRYNYSQKYFGIRCMLGLIANKIFDNPFLSYEPWTDFNRNPYYVGYYALGMHVYGIVQWLIQLCKDKKYETIHFVARDGYAAKLVYEIVRSYEPDLPKINYFYMSRKSLLPLTVKEAADLYNISEFLPYKGKTPLDIIELIKPILNWDEEKKYIYANRGIILNKIIETDEEYKQFISSVIELSYSQENNNSYRAKMKCYFSSILGKNDVMFDIGYSGRAQAILSSLLGYGINAAYIHYLGDQVLCYAKRFNFQADSYYEHVPVIIGKIREVIQSDIIGSCIGYTIDQDPIQPILEESNYSYQGRFVIQRIHQGMQDFVKDFMQVFSEYQQLMTWQKSDLGFAHEYYLHYPKGQDMNMFSVIQFEDDVLHNKQYRKQYLSDLWWNDLKWNNLLIKNRQTNCFIQLTAFPRWKRICYYALFERKTLKDKVIARCDNHPYLYKILHISYVSLRKTYYSVKKIKNKTKSIDNMANLSISNKHNCIKDKQNMDGKNKVFYYACSEYGILCCLMHRLKYYTEKECVLMISGWRKNRYESLRASGLFKEVQIFDDLSLRKIAHRIDNEIKRDEQKQINRFFEEYINEFESRLPYKLDSFEKIIIHNNTMPIGIYLEKNNIHYEALEDAAGIYSNPYLLLNSIKTTFPLIEQMLLKEYSIPEVSLCCDKWYINYLAQSQNFNKEKTEHFSVIKILEEMDDLTKSKVLSIFSIIPTSIKSNEETALILTYPLSTRLGITEEDQKTIYALLADIFADNKKKYLKPHPDDHTNYDDFGDINLIPSGVLSELLVYETGEHFNLALSTISTALNNLQDIERKVYFGDELIREYPNIIKYYIISHYISQYCSPTAKIIGSNISIEILHSISLYSDARYLQDPQVYTVDESFKISCDKIFVIGPATERKQIDTIKNSLLNNDCIISFNEFPGADILHIEKKKLCGGYLINLNNEKLFVYSKIGINKKFDFQKIMKTLNIKLTCTWTYEK